MTAVLSPVPVPELTSGAQLFRCIPYNCTMLARVCLERQARAALGVDVISLMHCKQCELGRQVKARIPAEVFSEQHLLRSLRATHRTSKALGAKLRAARVNPTPDAPPERLRPRVSLPIIGLKFEAPPVAAELPRAFTTKPPAPVAAKSSPQTENEEPMPKIMQLEGKDIAGVKVIRRVENTTGQAGTLWMVRLPCKHEAEVLGGRLGDYDRKGLVIRCKECSADKAPAGAAPRAEKPKSAPRREAKEPPERTRALIRQSVAREIGAGLVVSATPPPKSYEFPLRRDFAATVTLPTDLTSSDVQRITRWMETLVFEEVSAAE